MTEEQQAAESEFNSAYAALSKCLPGQPGMKNENNYGAAYQKLVQLKLRPQLKRRYRHGS